MSKQVPLPQPPKVSIWVFLLELFGLLILLHFAAGITLSFLYSWFLLPLGMPELSIFQLMGILLVIQIPFTGLILRSSLGVSVVWYDYVLYLSGILFWGWILNVLSKY